MLSLLLTVSLASAPTKDLSKIVWVHDDYAAAKKAAVAKKQLIAVDVWATWCHTCLSMKNYVLKEAPLAKVHDRLTWLAMDYDQEGNAAFFERYPVSVFPTFMVIDPVRGEVVSRWAGSGTAAQMAAFFGESTKSSADALARGHRALAKRQYVRAKKIFRTALTKENLDRHARTRLVSGLMEAYWKTDKKACAEKMGKYIDQVDNTIQGLDVVSMTAYCAESLTDKKAKVALLTKVAKRLEPVVADDSVAISVDDRSSVYGTLIDAYDALGKEEDAASMTRERLKLLEKAAADASTPAARATFDYHRMQAYLRLGQHAEAIRMLEASEKAQPSDFNHPWRLALVHLKQKNYAAGLSAIERALADGYGGRKLRLYSTKLDLLIAQKDLAKAKATAKEGRAHLERSSPGQVRDYWRKEFESKLQAVRALDSKS